MQDLFVDVKGSAPFGLFIYDNSTVIINSFAVYSNDYEVILDKKYNKLIDIETGQTFTGQIIKGQMKYKVRIKPSYYKVLRAIQE